MNKTTTEIGRELSEALNPGMEDALDARYGHLLPGMAEGVVDFVYGANIRGQNFLCATGISRQ